MTHIGIDLGGTKIEVIALDDAGATLFRHRLPTPQGDYSATLATIARLVHMAQTQAGKTGHIGIGTPGALSLKTGLIKNSNSLCLNGKPLQADLADLLQKEVRVENDANCFTLSEATDGAAAHSSAVFGVILGTGTGGGLVCHGRLWRGCNAIAGEWGHNPLPWPTSDERPGPACYCGKSGCIETYLSGPGLSEAHRQYTGNLLSAGQIAALSASDPHCAKSMRTYADRLARALAHVINIIDPDVIVLGGGLSNIEDIYRTVPAIWHPYVFSDHVATRLVRAKHGDSSGVRGAAWL